MTPTREELIQVMTACLYAGFSEEEPKDVLGVPSAADAIRQRWAGEWHDWRKVGFPDDREEVYVYLGEKAIARAYFNSHQKGFDDAEHDRIYEIHQVYAYMPIIIPSPPTNR